MEKKVRDRIPFKNPLVNPDKPRFRIKWFFGSSHFIMGLFAALGVFVAPLYLSKFFSPEKLSFLFIYLIIHLGLALDYYYDRSIDDKFLLFFYLFSIIAYIIFFVLTFY